MVDFSHLYMYSGGFSLIKFFFGDDDDNKNDKKAKKNKNDAKNNKKKSEKKSEKSNETIKKSNTVDCSNKKAKNTYSEKQIKLIKKLEIAFDNYLYRKKVKNLIQMQKDNYMIVCSANIPNLYLNIIRNKKVKQYKLTYEPILKLNVAFLPRKVYRNKKQLKFIFANLKKEIFFEPLYKTEYEDGAFINILDLQEIKEKESNDEENFQNFLKNYYKNKNNNIKDNIKDNNSQKIKEDEKDCGKKEENNISVLLNNKITVNKKVKSGSYIKVNKKVKKVRTSTSLKMKNNSLFSVNSILKERSTQRVKSGRKISFGDVQFSY